MADVIIMANCCEGDCEEGMNPCDKCDEETCPPSMCITDTRFEDVENHAVDPKWDHDFSGDYHMPSDDDEKKNPTKPSDELVWKRSGKDAWLFRDWSMDETCGRWVLTETRDIDDKNTFVHENAASAPCGANWPGQDCARKTFPGEIDPSTAPVGLSATEACNHDPQLWHYGYGYYYTCTNSDGIHGKWKNCMDEWPVCQRGGGYSFGQRDADGNIIKRDFEQKLIQGKPYPPNTIITHPCIKFDSGECPHEAPKMVYKSPSLPEPEDVGQWSGLFVKEMKGDTCPLGDFPETLLVRVTSWSENLVKLSPWSVGGQLPPIDGENQWSSHAKKLYDSGFTERKCYGTPLLQSGTNSLVWASSGCFEVPEDEWQGAPGTNIGANNYLYHYRRNINGAPTYHTGSRIMLKVKETEVRVHLSTTTGKFKKNHPQKVGNMWYGRMRSLEYDGSFNNIKWGDWETESQLGYGKHRMQGVSFIGLPDTGHWHYWGGGWRGCNVMGSDGLPLELLYSNGKVHPWSVTMCEQGKATLLEIEG